MYAKPYILLDQDRIGLRLQWLRRFPEIPFLVSDQSRRSKVKDVMPGRDVDVI
jgi:hypothetical protein